MTTVADLRAYAKGYELDLIEAVGGEFLLTESLTAESQRVKLLFSTKCKDANAAMSAATKAKKDGDVKEAKKQIDIAIKLYKELVVEAKKIDDDNILATALSGGLKSALITAAGTIAATVTGIGAIGAFGVALGFVVSMNDTMRWADSAQDYKTKFGSTKNIWKNGVNRTITIDDFERMIKLCEEIKKKL